MKMTVDLPDALVKEIKLRAVHDDLKLKDAIAELLRKGLEAPEPPQADDDGPGYIIDPQTRLPLILTRNPATTWEELTPDRMKDILLEQELERYRESLR